MSERTIASQIWPTTWSTLRIYMGIHFRFADTAGRREGTRVARQAFNHFLRPVRDRGHDHDKDCGDHDDGRRLG